MSKLVSVLAVSVFLAAGCAGMKSALHDARSCEVISETAVAACELACSQQDKIPASTCRDMCNIAASEAQCAVVGDEDTAQCEVASDAAATACGLVCAQVGKVPWDTCKNLCNIVAQDMQCVVIEQMK